MTHTYKPDWAPKEGGDAFACRVMTGIKSRHDGLPGEVEQKAVRNPGVKRTKLGVNEYVKGVLIGDRMVLSRAITLIESNAQEHGATAQQVLQQLLPYTGKSTRVGITGVPGAGKSTFIEALGCRLCEAGHKVAVLAVDPSSSITKGSILGDKTRMENLSKQANAFIRPSPSGGTLGGVTRKSRETMLLCEAAGYDVIFVETVGVGQSEVTVRSMVDFFLLVVLTGAGDELQGMKKGVMELADAILINKADGDNRSKAQTARADYERILHYLRPATEGWVTQSRTCSSFTGEGIDEVWTMIETFQTKMKASGIFEKRRRLQLLNWMQSMVQEYLFSMFFNQPEVINNRGSLEKAVMEGEMSATIAAKKLIGLFENSKI